MSYESPTWAEALKNMLSGLARQRPKPLLKGLAYFDGEDVSSADFTMFVRNADEKDAALAQLQLAILTWDAQEELPYPDGTPTLPRSRARREAVYKALALDSDASEAVETRAPMHAAASIVISKEFEPWYEQARGSRATVYWDDYEAHLRDTKGWDSHAISALNETTTDVVERLSDPTRETIKQTKGLVVGYVQSGKTANFTGVVAKAIDSGYRLIIVLTGTIEILRAQTQRRIDMELIGVENILSGLDPSDPQVAKELDYQQDIEWKAGNFLSHGAALDQPNVVSVQRVTTHTSDYKRLPQGLTRLKFQKFDKTKPLNDPVNLFRLDAYVAVIKKNSAPLKKLIADLSPIKGDLAQLPVLIIDDESDQASVDTTNPDKWKQNRQSAADRDRTTINGHITNLLKLCPRAQYVGYTATPFANVFVDPDDESDLFPADFVLSLRRPAGYMGVQEFHDVGTTWNGTQKTVVNSNERAHVRPLHGLSTDDTDRRDAELARAIDAWMLAGAIKKYRETLSANLRFRHHTMLVHESVKRADHAETADAVRRAWKCGAFTSTSGLERLRELYENDFAPVMAARADPAVVPRSFDQIKPFVGVAYSAMTIDHDPVLVVNSDKNITDNQRKLDFESDDVWRILVGGTQLSRGFTVEGLTVSYFRRKAGQADTLMQAGRWFGFRPGYQDLVRLYIRRDDRADLYKAFEALLLDEEAFRDELHQYEGFDEYGRPLVEPRQIPPLVSQHLPWLRPTARNKMWNAVIDAKATACGFQDLYRIPDRGDASNRANLRRVAVPLLAKAVNDLVLPYTVTRADGPVSSSYRAKVGVVDAHTFLDLFDSMTWVEGDNVIPPLRKFLSNATAADRITDWAILWPQPPKPGPTVALDGLGHAVVVERNRRENGFVGSSPHHRAPGLLMAHGEAVSGVRANGGQPADWPAAQGRGVVLVYLVDDRTPVDRATRPPHADDIVMLLSLAAPASATPSKRDLIQWTVRIDSRKDDAAVPVR
ncbi:Z1 domain-containing protein [Nocardia salmonicida]|uniref:Z1 domain-containing protein n=1 Tax=Nocardia salmonicida TaxID=53431 RepID=UPI0007A52E87|nr:Z1 domain-containing protein [Nocardia salmonicida]